METKTYSSRKVRFPGLDASAASQEAVQIGRHPEDQGYYLAYEITESCNVKAGNRVLSIGDYQGLMAGTLTPEEIAQMEQLITPQVLGEILTNKITDSAFFQSLPQFAQDFIQYRVLPAYSDTAGNAMLAGLDYISPEYRAYGNTTGICANGKFLQDAHSRALDQMASIVAGTDTLKIEPDLSNQVQHPSCVLQQLKAEGKAGIATRDCKASFHATAIVPLPRNTQF